MFVIQWQVNGGRNWHDYRGGVVRDNNTYLAASDSVCGSYCHGPANASWFDTEAEAEQFAYAWHKRHNGSEQPRPAGRDTKGNLTICCGDTVFTTFGSKTNYIIREYNPRPSTVAKRTKL